VALVKRILLFLLSIVFLIILLIGATTSNAKDEFDTETMEPNVRYYTIEWVDVANKNNKKYVCGTKVTTFDNSGRKFVMEYYNILMDDDRIISRFELDAIQISLEKMEPWKINDLDIKLYASKIVKDGKDILGGPRGEDDNYKGIALEFTNFDLEVNTELFKTLYKGGYNIEAFIIPGSSTVVPIASNTKYTKESEKVLDDCLKELINNYEKAKKPKGEVFTEQAQNVG
jgi:hypothetical protein